MRLSFMSWTLSLSVVRIAEGVIQLEEPKLPGSVVILGEGEIVDPDKWTDFPTPPPVVTNAPTPYPTPATPAPTPINYILLEKGDANVCPSGTEQIDLEDCLDAGELVAAGRFNFPFYLDELESDFTMPCGCFLRTKGRNSGKKRKMIVEYNTCEETTYYENQGYGSCDDGGGGSHYPAYYGHTDSEAECEAACTVIPDCIAYDWGLTSNCDLRFASVTIRDSNPPIGAMTQKYDGCGNSCNTAVLQGDSGVGVTLYNDDNFGGVSAGYYAGKYNHPEFVAGGMGNDRLSSLKVSPGYTVKLYQHANFMGWKAVFSEGEYTTADMIAHGALNNDASSIKVFAVSVPPCMKKLFGTPPGAANPDTQLICKLSEGIDAGVDDLSQWDKVYGLGTELLGNENPSLWAPDTLTGEFYIRRICLDCIDSHKNIIYKRLTPLPAGFNMENLFTHTWSSANNVLNVDFKLYSSMSYALADMMAWTYCNYDDTNVGFPRDCGPTNMVPYQWMNLASGGGQRNLAFYVWHGNPVDVLFLPGACVGSSPTECGCSVVHETDYRGTLATTKPGYTCQAWDSQFPHAHAYAPEAYPEAGLESNYCRNPNNWHEGAWCYTTDPNVRWALCEVQDCFVPPYEHSWYKEYPYMPWHLPPWHIAMNINPSDGRNAGWNSQMWSGEEDVGLDTEGLNEDYKDFTVNWQRQFDCLAIARHDTQKIDGVKVWQMNEVKTFYQYFNPEAAERVVVTSGGPVQNLLLEGLNADNDPILASGGPNNNLAFNWRYGNNGARIVLTDVGHPSGTLSCNTCDDDNTHGIGNTFSSIDNTTYHDISLIQDCSGASCAVQGIDHGETLSDGLKLGNYAFYVSMSIEGVCPEFLINNGVGNSLYNAGTLLCTVCHNIESPWMVSKEVDCDNPISPNTGLSMLETHCSFSEFWRENKWCQQSCYNAGYGYEADNCCNTSGFEYLGNFHCHSGYYTGWEADHDAGTMTVERCKEICLGEANCDYFSVWEGQTCSRYNANSCVDALTPNSPNHFSYKKLMNVA
mmetsp:Transcript_24396/g.36189  ORF Transcript_24396/g.36189 Transcript_24396/m.36189 type:complete len:1032 (+) Transcript_24396:103-3198(+)|eukprot:CAMPEP_0194232962 /NCGR_PEP_ID=MMETSP0158-20130606/1113_1 /TAXON_ID=33649 /ORGANISM="Thalassionema nitzschioides, Strain L26-B" /LENGTH=1031 /DNA_ID=CAMNT_0038965789 /DNA_START=84 /DNA_END=3179 /DNA_ORIENTATION=+